MAALSTLRANKTARGASPMMMMMMMMMMVMVMVMVMMMMMMMLMLMLMLMLMPAHGAWNDEWHDARNYGHNDDGTNDVATCRGIG